MNDKYKEMIHPYGYKVSFLRQDLIDHVTGLEAKAARWDYSMKHPTPVSVLLGGMSREELSRKQIEESVDLHIETDIDGE